MNVVTNKAIVIAIRIFVTIAITSAILISIDLMRQVYSDVYETDTNISSGFQEFDEYDGTQKTGLDLINTLNKYYNNSNVRVTVIRSGATFTNQNMNIDTINSYDPEETSSPKTQYNDLYNCSVSRSNNDMIIITFRKT